MAMRGTTHDQSPIFCKYESKMKLRRRLGENKMRCLRFGNGQRAVVMVAWTFDLTAHPNMEDGRLP